MSKFYIVININYFFRTRTVAGPKTMKAMVLQLEIKIFFKDCTFLRPTKN